MRRTAEAWRASTEWIWSAAWRMASLRDQVGRLALVGADARVLESLRDREVRLPVGQRVQRSAGREVEAVGWAASSALAEATVETERVLEEVHVVAARARAIVVEDRPVASRDEARRGEAVAVELVLQVLEREREAQHVLDVVGSVCASASLASAASASGVAARAVL